MWLICWLLLTYFPVFWRPQSGSSSRACEREWLVAAGVACVCVVCVFYFSDAGIKPTFFSNLFPRKPDVLPDSGQKTHILYKSLCGLFLTQNTYTQGISPARPVFWRVV